MEFKGIKMKLETDFVIVQKEIKEEMHTCDEVLREFISLMVSAGWQPGSIIESIQNLADEYMDSHDYNIV